MSKPRSKKSSSTDAAFDLKSDPYSAREAENYANPIASREHIANALASGANSFKSLVSTLSIKGQESRTALRRRLKAMLRDGQIYQAQDEQYFVINKDKAIQAKVQAHRDGFGFALLDNAPDLYLSEREMRQLFHGDVILVQQTGMNKRGQLEGSVVEVVERKTTRVVGRFNRQGDYVFLTPDNPRLPREIKLVDDPDAANIGDYVTVQILEYPTIKQIATAKVIERLGKPMAPGLEIELAVRNFNIPVEFSAESLVEADKLGEQPEEADKKHRVDLRHLPLVTIDGEDARDFDDAVYCEKRRGGFRLWVAIADVAHYVPVNSALDADAQERGTSVYFPGRVVPMLPEKISNGLCSLNPDVDRLSMVCEMEISSKGEVTDFNFYEAVIHSHARLTYNDVAEVLGLLTKEPREGLLKRLDNVLPQLQVLYRLYLLLSKVRNERGAIDFDTVETQLVFNEQKKVEAIVPIERNDAHKIIEECMLAANVCAATFLNAVTLDGLFRVHEGPKQEKLETLRAYLGERGLSLGGRDKPAPSDYQKLMASVSDRPDAHLIQVMMLRSMSQAVYEPDNNGHFGLAYEGYTHFTSPIRRYPDLLLHRALKRVIRGRKKSEYVVRVKGAKQIPAESIYPYDLAAMESLGMSCSTTERRAEEATRDVVAWLKCEYLSAHLGDCFKGTISGVTHFGFFVELNDLYVEGLVHVTSLDGDYFHYDAAKQRLIGERTRKVYEMGSVVDVWVKTVDLDARKVDLEIVDNRGKKSGDQAREANRKAGKKISKRQKIKKTSSARKAVNSAGAGKKANKRAGKAKRGSKKSR